MQPTQHGAIKQSIPVFNPDGKLSTEAIQACLFLKIDFESMYQRSLEEFKRERDVTERIAMTRHKYYEERRKERIKKIHDFINDPKEGLQMMKEHFPFFLQDAPTHVRNSKSANFTQGRNYGFSSPGSQERRSYGEPDIPLRVQLDANTALKQKIVNKEFEKKMLETVAECKRRQQEEFDQKKTELQKKDEEKKKAIELKLKQRDDKIKQDSEKLKADIKAKKDLVESNRREREREKRREAEMYDQKRRAELEAKEEQRRQAMELQFKKDIETMKKKADKKGVYQTQLNEEDKEIQRRIEEAEEKQQRTLLKKKMQMEERIQMAREQLDEGLERAYEHIQHQQENYLSDLYNNDKHFKKIVQRQGDKGGDKGRNKDSPQKRAEDLKEKNQKSKDQHQSRMQALKWEQRQQREALLEQKKQRESVAEKIRSELAEAHREYFEIMKLRKMDQTENYNRHKNLERLNAKKTALSIQEKLVRVDMIKQQQARIAQMCSQQRNPLSFGGQGDFNHTN